MMDRGTGCLGVHPEITDDQRPTRQRLQLPFCSDSNPPFADYRNGTQHPARLLHSMLNYDYWSEVKVSVLANTGGAQQRDDDARS
jgi:hypothetical protein